MRSDARRRKMRRKMGSEMGRKYDSYLSLLSQSYSIKPNYTGSGFDKEKAI
jgi:hypothetical protein